MVHVAVLFSILFSLFLSAPLHAETFPAPTGAESRAHSHNDFAQDKPLDLAISDKYRSIEVDVTDRWGEVRVTHLGFVTDGSLKEMYLDRLQKLVNEKGSVHGDGIRFYLWIEVRPYVSSDAIAGMLRKLLSEYTMFARFNEKGEEVTAGPVEAIIINSPKIVKKFFDGQIIAPACRGVTRIPEDGTPLPRFTRWGHFRWKSLFSWLGMGTIPVSEISKIDAFQKFAHARHLRTRFWDVPDTHEFWEKVAMLPLDLVNTDNLAATMGVLRTLSRSLRMPASISIMKNAKADLRE